MHLGSPGQYSQLYSFWYHRRGTKLDHTEKTYLVFVLDAFEVNACREEQLAFVKDSAWLPALKRYPSEPGVFFLLRSDHLCLRLNLLKAASKLLVVEEPCLPDDLRLSVVWLFPLALLNVLVSLVELLLRFHDELRFRREQENFWELRLTSLAWIKVKLLPIFERQTTIHDSVDVLHGVYQEAKRRHGTSVLSRKLWSHYWFIIVGLGSEALSESLLHGEDCRCILPRLSH